jgi:hypothetical protein
MKNVESRHAQFKQPSDEYIYSAIRYLDPKGRQCGKGFAVSFAIVAAVLIWGILLFILAGFEFH